MCPRRKAQKLCRYKRSGKLIKSCSTRARAVHVRFAHVCKRAAARACTAYGLCAGGSLCGSQANFAMGGAHSVLGAN